MDAEESACHYDDTAGRTSEPAPAVPLRHHWLWQPDLIVFVSSGCIMILELVAGRIVAPYVGVSLYTWTGIIGVVLAGISLGNYLGGWIADRRPSPRLLGTIFFLGGLASLGILTVDTLGRQMPENWPIIVQILVLTAALFFVPCLILGAISPVVAKLAVRDLARTGRTVGRIYAAGSVGSIVGTFATGFVLISWFGTHTIVWGVALVLLALGVLFWSGARWTWMVPAALIFAGATLLAARQGWLRGPCTVETNYFCIRVYERELNGEPVRVLTLDRLVHSYTSVDNPRRLVYGYEKTYAEIIAYRAHQDESLRALFIGGGGYTMPRYMEAVYPDSDLDVIEIDPGVTQMAHDLLGLSRETSIKSFNQDARLYLEQPPTERYDLILGDAFNDFSVPYHLTTLEFNQQVQAWLKEGGLYLVNIIDGPSGDFLRAYLYTLRQTFDYVYVVPAVDNWRASLRSTFILIASDRPFEPEIAEGTSPLADDMLTEAEVEALLAEGRVVLLTDAYAPVDQMLAPVFREDLPE